ncbi:hypothetical protein [Winogradskyella sp. A2]|uniref:hypothetical protein n=1 Tax=Winogradskyella sp. A2 TaxID=3366944 RepID=UPI00398C3CDF
MRFFNYIKYFLVVILVFSCNYTNPQEIDNGILQGKYKYQNINDPENGMVAFRIPLPNNWNYNSNRNASIKITAPNNVKVNKTETQNYAYSYDAFALQSLQQINDPNIIISPVLTINKILQDYVIPSAQSQGYSFVNSYPMPKVEEFWQRFDSGMLKTGSNRTYSVTGTDWKDANGNHSFIVFVQSVIKKGNYISWILQSTELEAPESSIKKAKESYIFGLANMQINMEWQQRKNRELLNSIRSNNEFWERATRQSQIQHNQRMAAIQSRGNTTRSIGNTYSDILDINHSGYLKRNDMNNAGQTKTVNMIGERATISNMATGERYNVKDGSKYYWVNNNGEYFGTDNAFYDPRIDKRVNNKEWSQFEIEN